MKENTRAEKSECDQESNESCLWRSPLLSAEQQSCSAGLLSGATQACKVVQSWNHFSKLITMKSVRVVQRTGILD